MKKSGFFAYIVKTIIVLFIPSFFVYCGSSNLLELMQNRQIIGAAIDVQSLKVVIGLIGCAMTALVLIITNLTNSAKVDEYRKINNQLLELHKEAFLDLISTEISSSLKNINIRIFVPKNSIISILKKVVGADDTLKFIIKNYSMLADSGITDNLSFVVSPEQMAEGLVGECFNKKQMIYDDNLEETNEKMYHLSSFQKNKTRTLKFSLVCPLFNDYSQDVVAIIAFDSNEHVVIPQHGSAEYSKFINYIQVYSQTLFDSVPNLFKAEKSLW